MCEGYERRYKLDTSPGTRPNCECHGEPMYGNGQTRWRCAVQARAHRRAYHERNREKENAQFRAYAATHRDEARARGEKWYWGMTGVELNLRLLRSRRAKALKRMAERSA
jgi:hypothetical protein